jgi:hypothetical protein
MLFAIIRYQETLKTTVDVHRVTGYDAQVIILSLGLSVESLVSSHLQPE